MTLREKIDTKNLEIQSVLFNEKDTLLIQTNIPGKLQELIVLIKSIESNSREFKNWVKENSIFHLEESINNCKKCYNTSKANTITRFFLENTVKNCKKLSIDAIKNLYSTAEFFEVAIACHQE
jgi:hypothetical protein